jgi:hypothetical protein
MENSSPRRLNEAQQPTYQSCDHHWAGLDPRNKMEGNTRPKIHS